jgi:hypothetical protein
LNDNTLCPACADKARCDHQLHQSQSGGLGRAAVFGLGAAFAGAAIYGVILLLTGYEFGLIAILNGWMVGKAMMKGARGKGGRRFQYTALMITYLSITAGYIPSIIKELGNMANTSASKESTLEEGDSKSETAPVTALANKAADAPADEPITAVGFFLGFAVMLGIAAILPVLNVTTGISGLIGIAIIVFGLMQAWKETQARPFALSGPFALEPPGTKTNEAPA